MQIELFDTLCKNSCFTYENMKNMSFICILYLEYHGYFYFSIVLTKN